MRQPTAQLRHPRYHQHARRQSAGGFAGDQLHGHKAGLDLARYRTATWMFGKDPTDIPRASGSEHDAAIPARRVALALCTWRLSSRTSREYTSSPRPSLISMFLKVTEAHSTMARRYHPVARRPVHYEGKRQAGSCCRTTEPGASRGSPQGTPRPERTSHRRP